MFSDESPTERTPGDSYRADKVRITYRTLAFRLADYELSALLDRVGPPEKNTMTARQAVNRILDAWDIAPEVVEEIELKTFKEER